MTKQLAIFTETTAIHRNWQPLDAGIPSQQRFFDSLPESAWVRESHLVRSSKSLHSSVAPLPFSAPTLWRMVKSGKFPKPTKLSARVTAWQVGQVRAWMAAQAMV